MTCQRCADAYHHKQFCDYCEQIYHLDAKEGDDGLEWIQCDTCRKWVSSHLNSAAWLLRIF